MDDIMDMCAWYGLLIRLVYQYEAKNHTGKTTLLCVWAESTHTIWPSATEGTTCLALWLKCYTLIDTHSHFNFPFYALIRSSRRQVFVPIDKVCVCMRVRVGLAHFRKQKSTPWWVKPTPVVVTHKDWLIFCSFKYWFLRPTKLLNHKPQPSPWSPLPSSSS